MEQQLDRIASSFARIANALEEISQNGVHVNGQPESLELNLVADYPFLFKLEPYSRAFKVELSNCTDTETPFDVKFHD